MKTNLPKRPMTTANPGLAGRRGMQEPSEGYYGAQATSQDNLTIKEDNADDVDANGCYNDESAVKGQTESPANVYTDNTKIATMKN